MGEIREEVQSFYMRDYVEEKVVVIFIIFTSPRPAASHSMVFCRWRRGSSRREGHTLTGVAPCFHAGRDSVLARTPPGVAPRGRAALPRGGD